MSISAEKEKDELARIHSPIGLDIGARSTAEIALSIAAQRRKDDAEAWHHLAVVGRRLGDLPTAVKDKARDAKDTAQAKIQDIQQHLHNGTEAVRDKADETRQQAKHLADQAVAKLPEPVVGRLTQVMAAVGTTPPGTDISRL